MTKKNKITEQEALELHACGRPGKLEIIATKPLITQRDLSLAYSPGVAAPCKEIEKDPEKAYDYTAKGNLVAVISNGTAVLGLGNIGALASKPVMEGKSVLFKRFADIDSIDLEIDTENVDDFVNAVSLLEPSFGGINLEDIKAPECFLIEKALKEKMNIPVFHDDQHGTAIITLAAFINALHLTNRKIENTKIVVNGAGAAAIACVELLKNYGVKNENVILCDRIGVIYKGRANLNPWKQKHAIDTKTRNLADAIKGADVFLGLSSKETVSQDMVKSMANKPIIFAMANPTPEIMPEEVKAVRPDAIIATGRADYPNQVNNVVGFPYIFRGALDVRAPKITEEMKIAAAEAISQLAREDVPDEVADAYSGQRLKYGSEYIIPAPFDPRLISRVPSAVAKAAQIGGIARKPITDYLLYERQLLNRLDPTVGTFQLINDKVRRSPKTVVFAEGEEEKMIRAAVAYVNNDYGKAILVGSEEHVQKKLEDLGLELPDNISIHNAALSKHNELYRNYLYERLQRQGFLLRDIQRMVHHDRHIFGACMVHFGHADGMITGLTRSYKDVLNDIQYVIDPKEGSIPVGVSLCVQRGKTLFIADDSIHERPSSEELAEIAIQAAQAAKKMGHEPRVAFLSYSNFGNPKGKTPVRIREAVKILEKRSDIDFEFDGEMSVDVALNPHIRQLYPFCKLTGSANVLITPGLHSASISSELLRNLSQGTFIGPLLFGLKKAVQIVPRDANVSELITMALLAAHEACSK